MDIAEEFRASMARNLPAYDQLQEDEFIDMDISSTTFLCYTISSPPHSREFEFHLSSNSLQKEPITSPADELFYKGKLLPLHLPPRLQMVEKLLQNSNTTSHGEHTSEEFITATPNTGSNTPFESCNISPSSSCYVSGELNPEEYYEESSVHFIKPLQKKTWSKKLKLTRKSSLGLKLKASRAYLKSLFTKSTCSEESSALPKAKECSNGHMKAGKKNPFGQSKRGRFQMTSTVMRSTNKEKVEEDCAHRRSFSGALKWHSTTKSSSSSSSSSCSSSSSSFSSANSNGYHGPQMLKRSSSVNSEVENSIQGAIAHCKKSQQLVSARKSVSDVGYCSLSASRIAASCENKERPGIYRG